MKLTIARRIGLSFLLIVLLMLGSSLCILNAVHSVEHEAVYVKEYQDWGRLLVEKEVDHLAWANALSATFLQKLPAVTVQTDDHKCGMGKWLFGEEAKELASEDSQSAELIKQIIGLHQKLHQSAVTIDEQWQKDQKTGGEPKALAILEKTTAPLLDKVRHAMGQLKERLGVLEQEKIASQEASMSQMVWVSNISAICGILFSIVIGLWLSRSILCAIKDVTSRLQDIAKGEGDLTQRVDESRKDEFGEMGRWVNLFIQKIHSVMSDVSTTTYSVSSASAEIAASSEEMACGMSEQQAQNTQISAAMEEMSASIVEVAKQSTMASTHASEAGEQAGNGKEVVNQTISGIKSLAEVVQRSSQAVGALGERSEKIGEIIEVINDIADQTNLLALNAAIEAARAGEHGRGFAVVADEVRKLAERTTSATEEVSQTIKAIQQDTAEAVRQMDEGESSVVSGVKLAEDAGKSLQTILEGSQTVSDMIRGIAEATKEQSSAAQQVAQSIEKINAVSGQTSVGAEQGAKAAVSLSGQAEELKRLVSMFKL